MDWFQSLRSGAGEVVLSHISGGPSGCADAAVAAEPSTPYVAAAAATGGFSGSVCDATFLPFIRTLVGAQTTYMDAFRLSREPVEETLGVLLDGVPVVHGWAYDPAESAVVFEPASIPDQGVVVTLSYDAVGDCGG